MILKLELNKNNEAYFAIKFIPYKIFLSIDTTLKI